MPQSDIQFFKNPRGQKIAWRQDRPAHAGTRPGLIWLGGLKSDMTGTKAEFLSQYATQGGLCYTRFDYTGHGASDGEFTDASISEWLDDAKTVFENLTEGPQILIGSSMGGWLALLLLKHHLATAGADHNRIRALLLIAPATDMTDQLIWASLDDAARTEIMTQGRTTVASDYDEPYLITRKMIEDGRQHNLLGGTFETFCPVRILHGRQDTAVPWQHSLPLMETLISDDITLSLVKQGDHSLSSNTDLALLSNTINGLIAADFVT